MKLIPILMTLLLACIMALLVTQILYTWASSICEESALKPVRYELGGWFRNKRMPILTTPENADGYERVCIRTGKPKFWSVVENAEYIVEMEKSFASQGGEE